MQMTHPTLPQLAGSFRGWRQIRVLATAAGVFLASSGAYAQSRAAPTPGQTAANQAQLGGLHRVAAGLESTLDIHRLAMVELVAAAKKILEAGTRPDATPGSPLPANAAEVLGRLSASVPARVPADALQAVSRAYEAEAVEALEDLGRADHLGAVATPLAAYVNAVGRLLDQADEIIDLFSRARPIETRVVEPDSMLDDINDALDELARAESSIARMRERRRAMPDQLQPFVRLEVALGHALDLIAESQEAGIHLGFEGPMRTTTLAATTKAGRTHLAALTSALREMQRAPAPLPGTLTALVTATGDNQPYTVRLAWEAPNPASPPAALRVYRQPNARAATAFAADVHACATGTRDEPTTPVATTAADGDPAMVPLAELPPGRSSLSDTLSTEAPLYVAPRYHVVPVNPFGVEGRGPQADGALILPAAEAPRLVNANLTSRNPSDPSFYRTGDLVEISWLPARSELPAFAVGAKVPVAKRYRVVRIAGNGRTEVAIVPASVHRTTDRPTFAELEAGVAYTVETLTDFGNASLPTPCKTAEVRADVGAAFGAAKAGIAFVRHPTMIERRRLEALKDPRVLEQAVAALDAQPAAERESLTQTWWRDLTVATRLRLLESWPDYVPKAAERRWIQEGVQALSERDQPWVVTELWLSTQPPFVQREIDRWWTLLDGKSQQDAIFHWRAHLDRQHRSWVDEHLAANDENALRPAKVLAWWHARDPGERDLIDDWWSGLARDERLRLYQPWLADQPAVVRLAVRWPDWSQRSAKEQKALLADAYHDLPDGLTIHMLAWLDWNALHGSDLSAAIATEVSWWQRAASWTRYTLRPLDQKVGFHLPLLLGLAAALSLIGIVGQRQRGKRLPRVRPPGSVSP